MGIIKKLLFASIIIFLLPFSVEGAGFYFLPQDKQVYKDESFIIELRLDTGGSTANAIEAFIKFPKEDMEMIDFVSGDSVIDLWVEEAVVKNGTIVLIGGATNEFKSKDALLGRLIVKPKTIGKLKLDYNKISRALLSDGFGTPLALDNLSGSYSVALPPIDLPQITSTSHPDSNKWNPSPNLTLRWGVKDSIEYSYLLSRDPLAAPDTVAEVLVGAIEYFGLDDGIYYFHLREKLPGKTWGEKSTLRIMVDATPPEFFDAVIGRERGVFDSKFFLVFNTQDKASGISHYEVCEGRRACIRTASPYILKNQSLGEEITVKAYDKAGHMREAKIKFPKVMPSYIWPIGIIILILVFVSLLAYIIYRKKKKEKLKRYPPL